LVAGAMGRVTDAKSASHGFFFSFVLDVVMVGWWRRRWAAVACERRRGECMEMMFSDSY
jgi:hypothetical protein